ncbi:hypothetical protein P689_11953 [Candidatus Riesia pediculischaeffi PTSU]|uniref:Uncharacterized protein n=1 Tax=Candidatus Riesia pediculischaeffi PTSU TaxID=1401651 RepID=A0A0C1S0K1_9ENTR|nr:hypothetical protein P689_11953 [Candidatus Riesia pediculischaeffi PTSU]
MLCNFIEMITIVGSESNLLIVRANFDYFFASSIRSSFIL